MGRCPRKRQRAAAKGTTKLPTNTQKCSGQEKIEGQTGDLSL